MSRGAFRAMRSCREEHSVRFLGGTRRTPCDVMPREAFRAMRLWREGHSVRCYSAARSTPCVVSKSHGVLLVAKRRCVCMRNGMKSILCDAGMSRGAFRAMRSCREGHSVRCFQIARNASRGMTAMHLQRIGTKGTPCVAPVPPEAFRAMFGCRQKHSVRKSRPERWRPERQGECDPCGGSVVKRELPAVWPCGYSRARIAWEIPSASRPTSW